MLKISHLTKRYGAKTAVDDLSLHIRPGEICGFIGRNGAGKTTTVKSCCGLLRFDSGEILVDGISVKEDPTACKHRLAYVPDTPDLYDFMTGAKYLAFVADIYSVPKAERESRVKEYAARLDLLGDLTAQISSYSHGMKQKLALIAALVHEPKLLLLDEPFVGLDPKATHELKLIMRALCESGGAVFFSTHVLEVAEKLCDTVAIIKNGRLIAQGLTEQVRGDSSLEELFLELNDDASV